MSGVVPGRRVDAEAVMVGVRWLAVAFAIFQTVTYYLPFPAGVEPWAWIVNAFYLLAAIVLTAWWLSLRHADEDDPSRRWLGRVSLAIDALTASAITWIYAFDPNTAIFAILYVVAVEGAFRYGRRGALLTMGALAVAYVARELWASRVWGSELLPASISFRMGIGFLIAFVAGAMAERYEREHRRLMVALERERAVAAALRSLDELRSTFLAAVSHELRTPLTSILGFSLTIQDQSHELSDNTRMMLDQVVEESQHLEQLLEDLLEIERMGRGSVVLDRHEADVASIAVRAAERIMRRAHREVVIEGDGISGMVDARKLERILDNLLGNAAKYSPEGTPVRVRVDRDAGGVHLIVQDEGPGVPEELRTTIFAPFERGLLTSAHQPGTGIGLSLVDRFARLHGGRAWVEDRADAATGAAFHVYLPDGPEGASIATVADQPWGERSTPLAG